MTYEEMGKRIGVSHITIFNFINKDNVPNGKTIDLLHEYFTRKEADAANAPMRGEDEPVVPVTGRHN